MRSPTAVGSSEGWQQTASFRHFSCSRISAGNNCDAERAHRAGAGARTEGARREPEPGRAGIGGESARSRPLGAISPRVTLKRPKKTRRCSRSISGDPYGGPCPVTSSSPRSRADGLDHPAGSRLHRVVSKLAGLGREKIFPKRSIAVRRIPILFSASCGRAPKKTSPLGPDRRRHRPAQCRRHDPTATLEASRRTGPGTTNPRDQVPPAAFLSSTR